MASQIEKMNRMRRNIFLGFLIGTFVAFAWFISPFVGIIKHNWNNINKAFMGGAFIWFSTLIIFGIVYSIYKWVLKKEPALYAAVYDERTKLNWLKACRFAFFISVGIAVLWKFREMHKLKLHTLDITHIPNGPLLVLYSATISLIASFLLYNREAKNE